VAPHGDEVFKRQRAFLSTKAHLWFSRLKKTMVGIYHFIYDAYTYSFLKTNSQKERRKQEHGRFYMFVNINMKRSILIVFFNKLTYSPQYLYLFFQICFLIQAPKKIIHYFCVRLSAC
jgi:hypothetical protein